MGSCISQQDAPQFTTSVNDISENELKSIFKHLPLCDRLIVSEVCQRWNRISRVPWRDVINIDLTTIPNEHLAAIVKHCPNLRSVIAQRADLHSTALHSLSRATLLSSVKLSNSVVRAEVCDYGNADLFSELFSERCSNKVWHELVLSDVDVCLGCTCESSAGSLPLSLIRLQLCGLRQSPFGYPRPYIFHLTGLGLLQNLTCLILSVLFDCLIEDTLPDGVDRICDELKKLTHLRELCIHPDYYQCCRAFCVDYLPFLPKLEVLFLFDVAYHSDENVVRLLTTHPSLRILFITGKFFGECAIPVRRRYSRGFGSAPLPLLHVFLDKNPSELIRFTKSSSDALRLYPISEPLPTFLQREEIAAIFDGVWIAAQIKEGAKHGAMWCNGRSTPATSIHVMDGE